MPLSRVASALLLTAGLLSTAPAGAYHPLDTDDTGTQGAGHWQLELSTAYGRDKQEGVKTEDWNAQAVLAYGLTDNLDLNLGLPYLESKTTFEGMSTSSSGVSDTNISLKWRFYERDGWSLGLVPSLSLPTGDEDKGLGNGRLSGGVNFILDKALSDQVNWHTNVAYTYANYKLEADREANHQHLWRLSTALAYTFAEHWKWATDIGINRNADRTSSTHPAFLTQALVFSPNKSTDLSLGLKAGLNQPETDATVLLGLTLRF